MSSRPTTALGEFADSHPHAAFAHREFRMFYTARLMNNLATNIMMPTLGWQIYSMTRDPLALGLIGLAVFVPVMLSTLPSGLASDRCERRNVYRLFQLGLVACALGFCGLTLGGVASPLWFYAVAGLFGAAKTFSAPSAVAWMPHLVPRRDFPNAVAWTSSAFQLSSVAGPATAGFMLALWGEAATYIVAGVLYFGSFLFATLVRTRSTGGDTRPIGFEHLFGGLNYIRSSPLILGAVTLDLFAVLVGGATAMLPVFAHEILRVGEAGFGMLRGAPAVGAAVTAVMLAYRPLRRRVGRWMFGAVVLFGIATILFGLSRSFFLSIFILIVLGAADMIGTFLRSTLVQLGTHDDMRGRVGSVNMVIGSARNEIGDMQAGFLASLIGVVPAVVMGGACTLAVAGLWAWRFPALRRIDRLLVSPETAREP